MACEKCKKKELIKEFGFWRLPPVLVIHVKRFRFNKTYNYLQKNNNTIIIPLALDVTSFCFKYDKKEVEK